jgi:LuxR family maltose regulon positive regulatory protein
VSLDHRDNDPVVFWTYVAAALETAAPGLGAAALALLESPRPPLDAVLATLLNDAVGLPEDVALVLDDYHVIDAGEVHEAMAFLLEHLPPRLRLVIATRVDPALPLARLRARGELAEIRAADLRFTADEAAAYLDGVMGLALTARDIAALEERTEGWIAALQLAALSMQGREDVAGFIAGFAGDDRYVVDFLVEEVLQRQPHDVRRFLLRTSILSRLNGSLCDAVTGQEGGTSTLEALDRANLFLVPLDDRRRWYRYHHLFADVLRARLVDEQPGRVPELHARASDWFERNGDRSEAIQQALAGRDLERAADLIELAFPAMRRGRQEATLRGWLDALPHEVVRVRPVLSIGLVGVLVAGGDLERVEGPLRDAERWLDPSTGSRNGASAEPAGMVVADDEGYRRLPGTVEMYRAALALIRGDAASTVRHARRAIDLSPDDDHLCRAAAAGFLGLVAWAGGDLEAASSAYSECMTGLRRAGHHADVLGSAITMADIRLAQGGLTEALRTYEQAVRLGAEQGRPVLQGTADMYVGMSSIACERNDMPAATRHMLRAEELGEHLGLLPHRYRWRVAKARIRQAEGDLDDALSLLDDAARLYDGSDFSPDARPIAALRARVLLARGDLAGALGWVRHRGLSVDDELSYLREFEHITLARVLLARSMQEQAERPCRDATRLLERLLLPAEAGGRTGSVIEILVLQALARSARGDRPAALAILQRAVRLAEPEGYVRVFVDAGPPLGSLLTAAAKQGMVPGRVRRMLAVPGRTEPAAVRSTVWSSHSATASCRCSGCSPRTSPARTSLVSWWCR